MARFLFVNQYYWPDVASTGQHLQDLCESLVARGHRVRVVCSRGQYLEGRGEAPLRETHHGVEIVRLAASSHGKNGSLFRRALDYLSFHLLLGRAVLGGPRPDAVVTLTTPPLLGVWGRIAQVLRRTKHVHWVMDLHPDAEFELGMLSRRSIAGRVLAFLCAHPMRRADRDVVLGPYQAQRLVDRGVDPHRIAEIPVWSSADDVSPIDHRFNPLRTELGWDERFVVLYSGNAGLVHRFDELLEAATILEERAPHVRFAFVGGGPRRKEIEAFVGEKGLTNCEFHGYLPRESLRHSLPAGDVHFMSLAPEQTGVAVPGKLYGILAAGRPVLFVGAARCESADTIRDADCGLCFEPGDGAALADAILALASDPDRVATWGRRARAAFLEHFEREVCCERWVELLEQVVARSASARDAAGRRAA
ncbi:MAG: glycosyltransferase family 4 protein [Planctomycetota bacterium]